jgi:hypothetical protein
MNQFTQEEFEQYNAMTEKFNKRCAEIAQIAKRYNESYGFIESWQLVGDSVEGEGDEYWNYGGHEHHWASFDANWLTKSDEEISAIVDQWIEKAKAEKAAQKEKEKAFEEARERAEFERLKQKFGEK